MCVKIRRPVWPVGRSTKKGIYILEKNSLYFTHFPRSPQWTDLHEILHGGSSRRRNHPFQILCRSVEGFRICAGSNFAILPLLSRSPSTQSWRYRAACDLYNYLQKWLQSFTLQCCMLSVWRWNGIWPAKIRIPQSPTANLSLHGPRVLMKKSTIQNHKKIESMEKLINVVKSIETLPCTDTSMISAN